MGKLSDLVQTSYEISKEKGWHDEVRSLAAITILMQSEVAEVLEEYRKNKGVREIWYEVHRKEGGIEYITTGARGDKPCGIPIELADLVIRIADYCGKAGIDLEFHTDKAPASEVTPDFEEWLARINYAISNAWGDLFLGKAFWLGMATKMAFTMADVFGINLWAAIEEKTEFNRTRPYRHGGKKI